MNDDTLYSIGELARRTGLAVRTIRFYSDRGVVPPTNRSPAGYRLYDLDALVRLDLVRTLRDLGVDLATIQRVLEREITVPEVAAAHAEVLDVQIRALRVRRAVLRAVAKRGSNPEELRLMHQLAELSDEERRRLINDFIDEAFGGLDANPEFVAMMRSAMPELPEEPAPAQLEAWVELAELVRDPAFKAGVRRAAEHQAADRADGDQTGLHHDLTIYVRERVESALADGIDPAGEEARPVLEELIARYTETFDKADTPAYREKLVTRLEVASDPLTERYWHLLAAVNGTPALPSLAPVFGWFLTALRQHPNP
jgi:DNA-binding transcriptional MerR regulator